jgi:hypothetical protein
MKIEEATAAVAQYRKNPNASVADFNKSMSDMATTAGNRVGGVFSWVKDKVTAGAVALATAATVIVTPAQAAPPEGAAGKPLVLITEDEAAAERKAQEAEAARIEAERAQGIYREGTGSAGGYVKVDTNVVRPTAAVPPTTVAAGPAIVAPPAAAAFTAASDPAATAAKPSPTAALDAMIEQANKGSDPGRLETLMRAREQVAKLGAPNPAP